MRLKRRNAKSEGPPAGDPTLVLPADPFDALPRWFYGLAAASVVVALLLPYRPVKYALALVLGGALVSFFSNGPHRILLAFLLVMPVLDLLPPDLIPIPALNTETIAVLGLAWAARIAAVEAPPAKLTILRPILFLCAVLVVTGIESLFDGVRIWQGYWKVLTAWDIFATLKNRVAYMFLAPIAFVLLWSAGRVRAAIHMIAWCTILVSVHAIFEVRSVLLSGLSLESNRATGLIANQPNLFGGFLAMMLAIFTPLFLSKAASFRERLLFGATLGLGTAAILFTLSRGSWLALAAGLVLIAAFRGARLVVFLLVVAGTAQWWLPEQVINRVALTTDEEARSSEDQLLDDSAQVRLDQWEALPTILRDAPILGHGFRAFPELWAHYGPTRLPKAAHSTWVEVASEGGLVGIAAYLWCVGALGWAGWRLSRRKGEPFFADLGIGFTAAILCLMILDTSGTRFREGEVMAFVWVLGGAVTRLALPGTPLGPATAGAPQKPSPLRVAGVSPRRRARATAPGPAPSR